MEKNAKLSEMQKKITRGQKEKAAMMARIDDLTARSGIEVEQSFHQDLMTIMQENSHVIAEEQFPEGTFHRLRLYSQVATVLDVCPSTTAIFNFNT